MWGITRLEVRRTVNRRSPKLPRLTTEGVCDFFRQKLIAHSIVGKNALIHRKLFFINHLRQFTKP